MMKDYLKAGFPALYLVTQEPHRVNETLPFGGEWRFFSWDCARGIRSLPDQRPADEVQDPVSAINWLSNKPGAVLIAHNLHRKDSPPPRKKGVKKSVILKTT